MNRQIEILRATESELRTFARDHLGLNLPPNAKVETLRSKIAAAWDKPYILVPEEHPEVRQIGQKPLPVTAEQAGPAPGKVRINISITEDAGGSEPVPVGVNGKVMLVPRGYDVDIPYAYFEVLQNAIKHQYDALPDGGLNPIARKVPLYPFQRVA